MKKLISLCVCLLAVLVLSACSGNKQEQVGESGTLVTTDTPDAPDKDPDSITAINPFSDPDAILGLNRGDVFEFDIDCGEFDYVCFFNNVHGRVSDWVLSSYNEDGWYLDGSGTLYSANGLCYVPDAGDFSFEYILTQMDGSVRAYFSNSGSESHADIYKSFTIVCGLESELFFFDDITMTFEEWLSDSNSSGDWYYDDASSLILSHTQIGYALPIELLNMTLDKVATDVGTVNAYVREGFDPDKPQPAGSDAGIGSGESSGNSENSGSTGNPGSAPVADTSGTGTTGTGTSAGSTQGSNASGTGTAGSAQGGNASGEDYDSSDDYDDYDDYEDYDDYDDYEDYDDYDGEDEDVEDDTNWKWDAETESWEWIGPEKDPDDREVRILTGIGWEWSEVWNEYLYYGLFLESHRWYSVSYPRSLEIYGELVMADLDAFCDPLGSSEVIPLDVTRAFTLSPEYRIFRLAGEAGSGPQSEPKQVTYEEFLADVAAIKTGTDTYMRMYIDEEDRVFCIIYS